MGDRFSLRGGHVVLVDPARPLEWWQDEVPVPGPGGMVVRVTLAGVCGTDVHRLAGHVECPPWPMSLGHEGLGEVVMLGPGTATDRAGVELAPGDRVYWSPATPCLRCWYCSVQGDFAACENLAWPAPADRPNAAAFREYATLGPGAAVYRVPDGTPSEAVIALGCALPAALGGLGRIGGFRVGDVVVVQGSGPVGLAVTMLADLSPAADVIVIGAPAHRLAVAGRFGATHLVDLETTTREERRAIVDEVSGGRGADVVVEAAGHLTAFDEGLHLLARNGRYLVLGLFSGRGGVSVDPVRLNNLNLRIVGSLGCQPGDTLQTVRLAARHHHRYGLADLITHRFRLSEAERAISVAATGRPIKVALAEP